MTQAERIARLETVVANLVDEVKEYNQKTDQLLALKQKGAGVFWLMSCIFGAGLAGWLTMMFHWITGK